MEYVWLVVALVILIAIAFKPLKKVIVGGLDDRSERIRKELDDARKLHDEAKSLLAKYERQLHEGESLAQEIIERGETDRKLLEEKMRADFEALVERRTKQAEERIGQEEQRAIQDVRTRSADLAIRATRRILTEKMGGDQAQTVIQNAIGEVGRKLA
jgi:F-type H+-transporting ATPase subunit b